MFFKTFKCYFPMEGRKVVGVGQLFCRPYGPTSSPLAREEQHSLGGFHQLRRGEKKKTDAIALDMCLDKHIFGCPSSSSFLFSIVFHFDVFVCFPTINTCVPAAQLKVDRAARRRTDLHATDVPAARREKRVSKLIEGRD
jgi:hypothetical protein